MRAQGDQQCGYSISYHIFHPRILQFVRCCRHFSTAAKCVLSTPCLSIAEVGKLCVKHTAHLPKANVIGPAVLRLRTRLNASQSDLVARLQIVGVRLDRTALSRIESGSRFVLDYEVAALALVLKVEVSALYPPIDWKTAAESQS